MPYRTTATKLTADQEERLRREYDGAPATITRLQNEFRVPRWRIRNTARKLGLVKRRRPHWKPEEEAFFMDHYGEMSLEQMSRKLGRTPTALKLHAKRRGVNRTYNAGHFSVNLLAKILEIDAHKVIRQWFPLGLKRHRCPMDRVVYHIKVEEFLAFLRAWPEAYDYRNAPEEARLALELDSLPAPPMEKLVVCRGRLRYDRASAERERLCGEFDALRARNGLTNAQIFRKLAWEWGVTASCISENIRRRNRRFVSCAQKPAEFWVPLYEDQPRCPVCGRNVGMYGVARR